MEKIDAAIVVLALVAVAGSGAGLVLYEGAAQGSAFLVSFEGHTNDGYRDGRSGISRLGEYCFDFDVVERNLTTVRVEAVVSTGGPLVQPRNIDVEVAGPDGLMASGDGRLNAPNAGMQSDTVTVAIDDIATVPEDGEVRARTLQAARDGVNRTTSHTNGTGPWEVCVTLSGQGQGVEASYSIDVTLEAMYYDAHVRPKVPEATPR